MRLAVYTDFPYHRDDEDVLWAEQAFGLFVAELRPFVERLVLLGRLDADRTSARHRLPPGIDLVSLPHYGSLSEPVTALPALARSLRACWRTLAEVDAVWLMGPHPLSILFAGLAALRRRRVFLGVRQDMPAYMARRYRDRPLFRWAAGALEGAYRLLSRFCPTVVVGPALAHNYAQAKALLPIAISLVGAEEIDSPEEAASRPYGRELTILSVGRLDPEKNPLLAVDILAELAAAQGGRWRLVVCGDGPLREEMERRLAQLGLSGDAELRGYVPYEAGMRELYRGSHFLLLTSWTEGLPQVALEAFATGLPVVTTDVGGLPEAAPDAVATFEPGDAAAGAGVLRRLVERGAEREQLMAAAIAWIESHTAEREAKRLATFIAES